MALSRFHAIIAAPVAAAMAFTFVTVPGAAAADKPILINEVVTNGDSVGDWVELYNPGETDINIGGWSAIDGGKNSVAITFPADTVVPAGGYYAFYTKSQTPDGSGGFGLGKKEEITIRDASGTEVDSRSWNEHARILDGVDTSWIRVGDSWEKSLRSTRDAANEQLRVVINELVSSGADHDWVELANPTENDVNLGGWTAEDGGGKGPITFPEGTVIPAGAYFVFDTEGANTPGGSEGFGLGKNDELTIKDADGQTVDYFAYKGHAEHDGTDTSWGRIPDMVGDFQVTGEATRGAANIAVVEDQDEIVIDSPVVINEIESNGDEFGDWVELYNTGDEAVDLSAWFVLDDKDTHTPLVIPAGTEIARGGFYRFYTDGTLVLDGQEGFGLGSNDTVRLFNPDEALVAQHTWSGHAPDTLGRIPDGTGEFVNTNATPEAANEAYTEPAPQEAEKWPHANLDIKDIDLGDNFNIEDMSGVDFDDSGRAWVVNNGNGALWALDYDAANDTYTVAGTWTLRYPDGTGIPDAEGVTVGHDGAIYVATERDNSNKNVSRPSVLRYDVPTGSEGELNATAEWNLAQYTGKVGANSGLEAISYIPGIGTNLYAVGVESSGEVLFVELADDGSSTLVQRYKSPFKGVMALDWEDTAKELRVLCDEVCFGQSILLAHNGTEFEEVSRIQNRPAGTDNLANEGFAARTEVGECVAGKQDTTTRYLWADDAASNGVALRSALAVVTKDCVIVTTTVAVPTTVVQPAPKPQGSASSSNSSQFVAGSTVGSLAAAILIPVIVLGGIWAAIVSPLADTVAKTYPQVAPLIDEARKLAA